MNICTYPGVSIFQKLFVPEIYPFNGNEACIYMPLKHLQDVTFRIKICTWGFARCELIICSISVWDKISAL